MDAALVIALIALAGSIFSTLVSTFGAPVFQGRRDARALLDTYREPLLAAAFELQSRLHNILRTDFVSKYLSNDDKGKQDAAAESTLYVFAQYFGWTEIIRREIRFLRFSSTGETREVARLLRDIGEVFLSDTYGKQLMIWRVEQRAIGERMIDPAGNGKPVCRGYASFLEHRDELKTWLDPVERDLLALDDGGRERLVEIQHLLLRLVRELDPEQVRYPFELSEA